MSRIPFRYWHFYDYPRNLRFSVHGRFFYLHSPFLEEKDDFATYFGVFELIGFASEEELNQKLYGRYFPPVEMLQYIGNISITALDFSPRRRTDIAAIPFEAFLQEHGCLPAGKTTPP